MKKSVKLVAPKREWIRPELSKLNTSDAEMGLVDYIASAVDS